jgi:hypothetical protein
MRVAGRTAPWRSALAQFARCAAGSNDIVSVAVIPP